MANIQLNISDQGIALLTLNRPEVLNVLNTLLMTEVTEALSHLAADDNVRALILTGRGRGFCAGADLQAFGASDAAGESLGKIVSQTMLNHFNPMMEAIYTFPKPVITAINGIAAGGGAAMALCGDIVLAARSATLKVVQVPQLGIVADLGANWLLPRISGRSRAMGACLLGDSLPSAQLLDWGLVWECVDDERLLDRAREVAGRLAAVPAEAIVETRRLVDSSTDCTFTTMLERERLCQEVLCDTPFFADSVASFLAK